MQSFAESMAESCRCRVPLSGILREPRYRVLHGRYHEGDRLVLTSASPTRPGMFYSRSTRGKPATPNRPTPSLINGVFQAVREFVEVGELETLVFATKRAELAGIHRTYLPRESSTLANLG